MHGYRERNDGGRKKILSRNETILLYLGVMLVSCFLAFYSQSPYKTPDEFPTNNFRFRKLTFIMSLMIPWFFLSFTKIGVDYNNYYNIVNRVDWNHLTIGADVEPLFNLLCVVLKTLAHGNIHAALFLMKSVTVILIGCSIYIMKDRIRVGYAVMAYLLWMYLASFYLLSICLASSLVMLAVAIWRTKDKILPSMALIIFSGLLHNSVFILLPAFILCIIFKKSYGKIASTIIIVSFIIATVMASSIYNFVATNFTGFHYTNYVGGQTTGSGIMILFRCIPVLYFWAAQINKVSDKLLVRNTLIFTLSSCMFFIMGYQFIVVGRMEYDLLFLYTLLFPEMFVLSGGMFKKKASVFQPYQLIALGYYLMRGYIEFTSRTGTFSTINNYEFFNPFA